MAKQSMMYSLTRELQEIGLVGEDQVVVGDKVKEPNVQLLCVVALEDQVRQKTLSQGSNRGLDG